MFSKLLATIAVFFIVMECQGTNYYFSANGNDSYTSTQAQSSATPWQTITKLNSYFASIKAGDSVLFKCGETFSGTILVTKSGAAGSPIVISSYGTGAKPIITGLTSVTGWTTLSAGIYKGNCPSASTVVNVVLLNGAPQPIGRYPNADAANKGYVTLTAHVGDTQITSTTLNTAVNWTGGEVVIRKNHWTIDRGTISSNTANVINYTDASSFQPLNNFGFFIQNHPSTLDQVGEWYYDPATKTLQLYNGATSPAAYNIQVGSVDNLFSAKNQNYVNIEKLSFYGANTTAINLLNVTYFTIKNCDIFYSGVNAIGAVNSNNMTVSGNNIQGTNNVALTFNGNNATVSSNTINNTGLVAGMGQSMDPAYCGISFTGTGNTFNNNTITNVGDDGITFSGDNIVIKNNFISNFNLQKDDGGGIYIWGNKDTTTVYASRAITGNICVNGNAASAGTAGTFQACTVGIYLDDNSSGVTLTGNTVANCPGGVKLHNAHDNTLTTNTLFNNGVQLISAHDQVTLTTKNNTVKGNILFSELAIQPALTVNSNKADIGVLGTFSGNYYSNIIDNQFQLMILNKALNLPMWQALYGKDNASSLTAAIPYYTVDKTAKRSKFKNSTFASNITGALSYSVNGNFKIAWQSKLDLGSLNAYFTTISGATNNGQSITAAIGALNAGNIYVIKFSLLGTKTAKKMTVYMQNTASPYNAVTEKQYGMVDVNRTENTFIFTPLAATPGATLVIAFEDEDQTLWIDNLGVYQATGTINNPNDYLYFAYNNTTATKTVPLSGSWLNVKNVPVTGSVAIAPFSSVILIKNLDTAATAPPVIYDAPNTTKNMTAYNLLQKSTQVSVYPNPASDYLTFSVKDANVKDVNVKILNSSGDVILSQKVQVVNNSYQVNFRSKPQPGAYFIQLSGSGISHTSKFIVM